MPKLKDTDSASDRLKGHVVGHKAYTPVFLHGPLLLGIDLPEKRGIRIVWKLIFRIPFSGFSPTTADIDADLRLAAEELFAGRMAYDGKETMFAGDIRSGFGEATGGIAGEAGIKAQFRSCSPGESKRTLEGSTQIRMVTK